MMAGEMWQFVHERGIKPQLQNQISSLVPSNSFSFGIVD